MQRRPECRQGAEPAVARAGDKQFTVVQKKGKAIPYSNRALDSELIAVFRQSACRWP